MTDHNPVLFDTSIATDNIGDEIIIDAVRQVLQLCANNQFFVRLPTHDFIGKVGRRLVRDADICFIGGTNLLSSQFRKYRQWKISPLDAIFLRGKVVLVGVGWWQYQKQPDKITCLLYHTILSQSEGVFHSVRDEYTRNMLESIGITNVLNTGCPTMWALKSDHCRNIPTSRGESVVMTLTDYNKNIELDRKLYQELTTRYSEVIAWPQGVGDRNYMMGLQIKNIIGPGLSSLDQVLSRPHIDYVGTRLHAGIRALQHGRRSLILAVDNRAKEISKDTNLWVVDRSDIQAIRLALDEDRDIQLKLNYTEIHKWMDSIRNVMSIKSNNA